MLKSFHVKGERLQLQTEGAGLEQAQWIDLFDPGEEEVAGVQALGFDVPKLADMEEIEISNRLYKAGEVEVLTVALPGIAADGGRKFAPVAFLLSPRQMVTVRYHAPRSFDTFPSHAHSSSAGCDSHLHLFLGLIEEIVARIADLLEGEGRALDAASRRLFNDDGENEDLLEEMLRTVGQRGEALANHRHALLTLERALTTFALNLSAKAPGALKAVLKARTRDIQSLVVHADFLTGRVAHVTDVILGMINLEQSDANRILSVVAVLFLPPTLVASIYGMNFQVLPGVNQPHGWLIATGLMAGSAIGTYVYFKWKDWL
ncbi:CorA family divalent cation transporter [Sagittula salina]|uniref:Magnesium transporter n=1 Tax=Sagittula salina TaxID=2820268 RepID=A0A940MS30_9RHOB|nr:CorA family divalent cation transporter [Sagittula salina]MBP0483781.1 magnesium transporter [Sagittula salina]